MNAEGQIVQGELVGVVGGAYLPFDVPAQPASHPCELFRRLPVLRIDRDSACGGSLRLFGEIQLHPRAREAEQRLGVVGPRGKHPIELGGRQAVPPLPQEGERQPVPLFEIPGILRERLPGETLRLVQPVAPAIGKGQELPRFPIRGVSRHRGFQNRQGLGRPVRPQQLRPEGWCDLRAKGRVGGNRGLIGPDRLRGTVSGRVLVPQFPKPPRILRAVRRPARGLRGRVPSVHGSRPRGGRKESGHHRRQDHPIAPLPLRDHFLSVFHKVIFGRRPKNPIGVKKNVIVDIRAQ